MSQLQGLNAVQQLVRVDLLRILDPLENGQFGPLPRQLLEPAERVSRSVLGRVDSPERVPHPLPEHPVQSVSESQAVVLADHNVLLALLDVHDPPFDRVHVPQPDRVQVPLRHGRGQALHRKLQFGIVVVRVRLG